MQISNDDFHSLKVQTYTATEALAHAVDLMGADCAEAALHSLSCAEQIILGVKNRLEGLSQKGTP